MRFLFTSYVNTPEYHDPEAWLRRIEAYTGILKALANSHEVISIEHISYEGIIKHDSVTYQFVNSGKLKPLINTMSGLCRLICWWKL